MRVREANTTVAKQEADMKQLNAVIMEADKARRCVTCMQSCMNALLRHGNLCCDPTNSAGCWMRRA